MTSPVKKTFLLILFTTLMLGLAGCRPIARVESSAIVEKASEGSTVATLQTDGVLQIIRGGWIYQVDTVVSDEVGDGWHEFPHSLRLEQLDADPDPEIVLIVSTRGASCCTTLSILDYSATENRYLATEPIYRKYTLGFDQIDLDEDGIVEFRTLNEAFHYALGGASVSSFASPLQILRYADGRLQEVTVEFPRLIETHANQCLLDPEMLCSVLGAGTFLAEMAMLHQVEKGWSTIQSQCELSEQDRDIIQSTMLNFGYQ